MLRRGRRRSPNIASMADLVSWASDRWDARFTEPNVGISNPAIDAATLSLAEQMQDLERRRIELRTAISHLGADAWVLEDLERFEAVAGIVGLILGVHHAAEFEATPPPEAAS